MRKRTVGRRCWLTAALMFALLAPACGDGGSPGQNGTGGSSGTGGASGTGGSGTGGSEPPAGAGARGGIAPGPPPVCGSPLGGAAVGETHGRHAPPNPTVGAARGK